MGIGARLAATAILFGASSIAGAKTFERYDTPVLALLAPPPVVLNEGSESGRSSSSYTETRQWFRLSLDGELRKTERPIRTTLLPPPAATPALPPLPALPPPQELRHIRSSLDQASIAELGHASPGLPRPIRLFLGSEAPSPSGPRPFRSVLD